MLALAALAVAAAGCGGSSRSGVAQLGSTTGPGSTSTAAGSTNSYSLTDQPLAFSHCMRSHGVRGFPDPETTGVWPKTQVSDAANAVSGARFQAATQACGHLLPDGGPGVPPSAAVVQQIETDMTKFARCMRLHGVPNWPDPIVDNQGRGTFDTQAAGVNTNSAQITAKIHACNHVYPASIGVPWAP